jgi:hypothetical protein
MAWRRARLNYLLMRFVFESAGKMAYSPRQCLLCRYTLCSNESPTKRGSRRACLPPDDQIASVRCSNQASPAPLSNRLRRVRTVAW